MKSGECSIQQDRVAPVEVLSVTKFHFSSSQKLYFPEIAQKWVAIAESRMRFSMSVISGGKEDNCLQETWFKRCYHVERKN